MCRTLLFIILIFTLSISFGFAASDLVSQFYSIIDPGQITGRLQPETLTFIKCGTPVMISIQNQWDHLSPDFQKEYQRYFTSGFQPANTNTYTSPTGNFTINWGDNLTNNTDADANGIPDIVELWAQYFEQTWQKEVSEMGFTPPNIPYNVYIGSTWSDPNEGYAIGSNVYGYASSAGYIVVRQDYTGFPSNDDPEGTEKGAMKVTAAHEFHHAIQFLLDTSIVNSDRWWMEATSTWMEDAVFNEVNDYVNYLNGSSQPWRNYPFTSLTLFNGLHEYGDMIWTRYLSETYASGSDVDGSDAIFSIWQNVASQGPLTAMDTFFQSNGTTLKDAYHDFAFKNLKMDYEEGSSYGSMKITATETEIPVMENPTTELPDYLGCNYIQIDMNQNVATLNVSFDGDDLYNGNAIEWRVSLVNDDGSMKTLREIPLDSQNAGNLTMYALTSSDTLTLIASVVSDTGLAIYGSSYASYPNGVPYTYSIQLEEDGSDAPLSLSTVLNFPNPFSDSTVFNVNASRSADIELTIYDQRGYQVKAFSGTSGTSIQIPWDGRDEDGQPVANGVYFYRVKATDSDGNTVWKSGKCAVLR